MEQEKQLIQSSFALRELYEFSQISELIMGKPAKVFTTIAICSYLTGVISSKTIMSAHILSKTFEDFNVLSEYYFWVVLFFFSSALFSFKDVSSTKWIQIFIAIIRLFCLILFIFGPIYVAK